MKIITRLAALVMAMAATLELVAANECAVLSSVETVITESIGTQWGWPGTHQFDQLGAGGGYYCEECKSSDFSAFPFGYAITAQDKEGYNFSGWYTPSKSSSEMSPDGADKRLTTNKSLTLNANNIGTCKAATYDWPLVVAKYEKLTFTVEYNGNGSDGGSMTSQTGKSIDSKFNLAKNEFTRTGYKFNGWEDELGNGFSDGQSVTGEDFWHEGEFNGKLSAQWKGIQYTLQYEGIPPEQLKNYPTKAEYPDEVALLAPTSNGYELAGWTIPAGMLSKNAQWRQSEGSWSTIPNSYTNLKADDKNPNKTIWVRQLNTNDSAMVTIRANWEPKKYKITLNAPGAVNTPTEELVVKWGEKLPDIGTIPKYEDNDGRVFDGYEDGNSNLWYKNDGTPVDGDYIWDRDSDLALKARYTSYDYTLTFDPNKTNGGSGSSYDEIYSSTNKAIVLFNGEGMTNWGHKVIGWGTSDAVKEGGAGYFAVTSHPTLVQLGITKDNITRKLYAVWKDLRRDITFDKNGGDSVTTNGVPVTGPIKYVEGEQYGFLPESERAHYKFAGWFTGDGMHIETNSFVTKAQTLYAHWNPKDYYIEYEGNGADNGALVEVQAFKFGEKQRLFKNEYSRLGYAFAGWSKDAAATTSTYKDEEEVVDVSDEDDVTNKLYAVWKGNEYSVKFYGNGGTGVMAAEGFSYGAEKAITLNGFVRANYEFLGWVIDPTNEVEFANGAVISNLTMVAGEVVPLYAKWRPIAGEVTELSVAADCDKDGDDRVALQLTTNASGVVVMKYLEDPEVGLNDEYIKLEYPSTGFTEILANFVGTGYIRFKYKAKINALKGNVFEFLQDKGPYESNDPFLECKTNVEDWTEFEYYKDQVGALVALWQFNGKGDDETDYICIDDIRWLPDGGSKKTTGLTFRRNDGTEAPADIVANWTEPVGDKLKTLPEIEKSDKREFVGWKTEDGVSVVTNEWKVPRNDTVILAQWETHYDNYDLYDALDCYNLTNFSATSGWVVEQDGGAVDGACVQLTDIGGTNELTAVSETPGTLEFSWKAGEDTTLQFYVDDTVITSFTAKAAMDWERQTLEVMMPSNKNQVSFGFVCPEGDPKDFCKLDNVKWTPYEQYTVKFCDPEKKNQTVASKVWRDHAAVAPTDWIAPEWHEVGGWDVDFSKVTSNMMVNAIWTPLPKYDVTFHDPMGANEDVVTNLYKGTAAIAPTDWKNPPNYEPTYGWDADFSKVESDMTVNAVWMPTAGLALDCTNFPVVVSGGWKPVETGDAEGRYCLKIEEGMQDGVVKVTVTNAGWLGFNFEGGAATKLAVEFGEKIEVFEYVGPEWQTNEVEVLSDGETEVKFGFTNENDLVEFCQLDRITWKPIEKYEVTFHDTKGLNADVVTNVWAKHAAEAPKGWKAPFGFDFEKWDADFSKVESDMTVNAVWKEKDKYEVTFHDPEGNNADVTTNVYDRTPAIAPKNWIAPTDYQFESWDADFSNITSNTLVNAKWMLIPKPVYAVTFHDPLRKNADVVRNVEEGSGASAPTGWTANGYEFTGWDRDFSRVMGNMTVNAVWEMTFVACKVKVAIDPIELDVAAGATVKLTGQPSGIKLTTKATAQYAANTIYGTPTKMGVYYATITETSGGVKTVSTLKFIVESASGSESIIDVSYDTTRGSVKGLGMYAPGKKATLKATANKGYVFAGWYLDPGFTVPAEGSVDYRTASFPVVAGAEDTTYYARFVTSAEDMEIYANVEESYKVSGYWSLPLEIESLSLPKVSVKNLPKGLKYNAKTLTIAGTPTKPGVNVVQLQLKNQTVKKGKVQTFEIAVPNIESPYLDVDYDEGYIYDKGEPIETWYLAEMTAEGYAVSGVSNLPKGLKFDKKTQTIYGTPTKVGVYTVTFKLKGPSSSTATVTMRVKD